MLWTAGCATQQPAPTPSPPPFATQLMATEFALCDAADAYRAHVGRWPRTRDELRTGAAWVGLDIPGSAYDRTILHQTADGRLILEFVRDGGSIYATKGTPPTEPAGEQR
jgi:hypothetical protein